MSSTTGQIVFGKHTEALVKYSVCIQTCSFFTFCTNSIISKQSGTESHPRLILSLVISSALCHCHYDGSFFFFQGTNRTCSHGIIAALLQADCMVTYHNFSFLQSAGVQL